MIARADLARLFEDPDFSGVFAWKLFCSHDGTRKPAYLGRLSGAVMSTTGPHAEWTARAGLPSVPVPVRFFVETKTNRDQSRIPTSWNGKGLDPRGVAELGRVYSNTELPYRCPVCNAGGTLGYRRAAALVAYLFDPAAGDGYSSSATGRAVHINFRAQ